MTSLSPRSRPFHQVDVFSSEAYRGNPLAVVMDAGELTAGQMQRFANWTNLSETSFLLPPTDPRADYRVRIFTGSAEFAFAGHPTLGSAHAWLESGGVPKSEDFVVQECGAGLVRVKRHTGRLAFAAPPLTTFGPVGDPLRRQLARALRLPESDILDASWLVNGPEWIGVLLGSAAQVLAIEPDFAAMEDLNVGVIGAHPPGGGADFEVRAFLPGDSVMEDPATGSFNAGAAQWLINSNRAPGEYVAAQGAVLGRAGRLYISSDEHGIWVGGNSSTCIRGSVLL